MIRQVIEEKEERMGGEGREEEIERNRETDRERERDRQR